MKKEFEINFGKVSDWVNDMFNELEDNLEKESKREKEKECCNKHVKEEITDYTAPMTSGCISVKYPLVNFYSDETGYVMDVIAPYTPKDEIKLDIDKDAQGSNIINVSHLFVKDGKFKQSKKFGAIDWLRSELKPRSFSRTFKINKDVKISKITAKHENGILSISMPKSKIKTDEKRKINIQ